MKEEIYPRGTIVVKIGGSTLGGSDTTLDDLALLQKRGFGCVIIHGGGKIITKWMSEQGLRPRFVRGLRVTDKPSLDIAVAVLAGLVNKNLVASLSANGCEAVGVSGVDGGMLQARLKDTKLGLVGRIIHVNPEPIRTLLDAGYMPVIAPLAVHVSEGMLDDEHVLNINADTAAGEIALSIGAEQLIFLTDVEGVLDTSRRLMPKLTQLQVKGLIHSNVVAGGMIPKLEACLVALKNGGIARIVDGQKPHALIDSMSDKAMGTCIS
jgi:acetylglutamate kinase